MTTFRVPARYLPSSPFHGSAFRSHSFPSRESKHWQPAITRENEAWEGAPVKGNILPGRSRRNLRRILSLTLLLLLASLGPDAAWGGPARKQSPAPAPDGHKFLFIVDTASSMQRLEYDGRQAVFDMLHSGLEGQLRSGDTFGIWTFDETIHAGEYPMQVWNPSNRLSLASQATLFIKGQPYRGSARFDPLVTNVLKVIKAVQDVNIFVVSDEKVKLKGTPFDDAVNKIYQQRDDELRKSKQPFVTTLLARDGVIVTAGVTLAGEPITLPPRPPPVARPEPAPPAPREITTAQVPPPARPVRNTPRQSIIINKQTIRAAESAILSADRARGFDGTSNSVATISSPPLKPDEPSHANSVHSNGVVPMTGQTERAVQVPPSPAGATGASSAANAAGQGSRSATDEPSIKPDRAPGVLTAAVLGAGQEDTAAARPSNPDSTQQPPFSFAASQKVSNPNSDSAGAASGVLAHLLPSPQPVAARELPRPDPSLKKGPLPGTALTGVTLPARSSLSSVYWMTGGAGLCLLVLTVGILLRRRSRQSTHTSFITRSMQR
jgi:hypothetical protein